MLCCHVFSFTSWKLTSLLSGSTPHTSPEHLQKGVQEHQQNYVNAKIPLNISKSCEQGDLLIHGSRFLRFWSDTTRQPLSLYLCGESWLFEGHLPCFEWHLCWGPWGFWLDSYPNLSKHTFVNYRIILVWKRLPLHSESQLSTLSGESLLTSLPWVSTVCDPQSLDVSQWW